MIETDLTRLNIRLGDIKNAIRHSASGSPPYLWEMKKPEIEDYLRKQLTEEEIDDLYRWIRTNVTDAKIDPRWWPPKVEKRKRPLNGAYLPDNLYPTDKAVRAAQAILGICGSHAGRRVKHSTTAEILAKQLTIYKEDY